MKFRCVEGCSDCCIYREYYPDRSYGKIGVLILPWEKERIEKLAADMGKRITILPRIGIGTNYENGKKTGPKKVIAYQLMGIDLDGNTCPFLDTRSRERSPHGGYKCMIYEERPLACRAYPVIESDRETVLDSKCKFCQSCTSNAEGLETEIEALSLIKGVVSANGSEVWRYATGVGLDDSKEKIRKGWVLQPP